MASTASARTASCSARSLPLAGLQSHLWRPQSVATVHLCFAYADGRSIPTYAVAFGLERAAFRNHCLSPHDHDAGAAGAILRVHRLFRRAASRDAAGGYGASRAGRVAASRIALSVGEPADRSRVFRSKGPSLSRECDRRGPLLPALCAGHPRCGGSMGACPRAWRDPDLHRGSGDAAGVRRRRDGRQVPRSGGSPARVRAVSDCAREQSGEAKWLSGIDHSAISVADAGVSRRFYEALGLTGGRPTLNEGPTQAALDGLAEVRVDVVPMVAADRHAASRVAADTVVRSAGRPAGCRPTTSLQRASSGESDRDALLRDPDGHLHLLMR